MYQRTDPEIYENAIIADHWNFRIYPLINDNNCIIFLLIRQDNFYNLHINQKRNTDIAQRILYK